MAEQEIIAFAIMTLFFMALWLIESYISMLRRKSLDRYRLKYGFDREIERKDMYNPTEHKLDEVEKRFNKRVFKD